MIIPVFELDPAGTPLSAALTATAATALATTLVGCANPNAQPTNVAFVPHIAVILGTESPSYAATLKAAAESAAKEFGQRAWNQ